MQIRKTVAALMTVAAMTAPALAGAQSIKNSNRATTGGKYGLELDNVKCGWLTEVDGGHAVADVVTEKIGADSLHKKHIDNVRYDPVTATAGSGMCKGFYDWIQAGFAKTGAASRRSGAIVSVDGNGRETSRMTFTNALVTEFGMPALDAASKNAARMTLKFKPELTRYSLAKGGAAFAVKIDKQRMWLPSNFRLKIEGLDAATPRVNKIDSLVIKQKLAQNAVGERRDYEQQATSVELPNLVITLAESHAKPLYDWHEDFVIKGKSADANEKGGTLEYLAPDLKTVLFTLTFKNLGVFKVAPDKMEAGGEGIRRIKAEMYMEDVRFSYSPAATFGN